jgi:large subunit ribosomal protein L25
MKSVSIEGKPRADFGKTNTRTLRATGEVPCVIYGGDTPVHFSAPTIAFKKLVYTPEFQLAEVTVDGRMHRCILKDLQFDVVTDELTHVDFLELVEGRKIVANLPLKFTGSSVGVKAGGRMEVRLKTLKVRTEPQYLRENITVDVSALEIGGNLRVQEVDAANMEVMNAPRQPVVSIVTTRALRQAEQEEKAAAATAKK